MSAQNNNMGELVELMRQLLAESQKQTELIDELKRDQVELFQQLPAAIANEIKQGATG